MGNALRALVLLVCSAAALVAWRSSDAASGLMVVLAAASVFVPFTLAVVVAWRGHDR